MIVSLLNPSFFDAISAASSGFVLINSVAFIWTFIISFTSSGFSLISFPLTRSTQHACPGHISPDSVTIWPWPLISRTDGEGSGKNTASSCLAVNAVVASPGAIGFISTLETSIPLSLSHFFRTISCIEPGGKVPTFFPSKKDGPLYLASGHTTIEDPCVCAAATIFASRPWSIAVIGGVAPT